MAIRNFAAEAFGKGGGGTLVPRQKFEFTLVLFMSGQATQFTQVSSVTLPSYSFDTVIANQYNRKRVVQTKINYDPVVVSFYDTFDNKFQTILESYIAHYYHGGQGIADRIGTEGVETAVPNFQTDKGFTPNADRYFFPKIQIIQHGVAGQYRETTIVNPMITDVRNDSVDYSDSQPVFYTVTFQPEFVQTRQVQSQFEIETDTRPVQGPNLPRPQPRPDNLGIQTSFDTLFDAFTAGSSLTEGSIISIGGQPAQVNKVVVDGDPNPIAFFTDPSTGLPL